MTTQSLTVVTVHGWGSSPRTWSDVPWPKAWKVIDYTVPGHAVRVDEGPWTIPAASEDLACFIRRSVPDGQRVLLVAHSMGGQLSALVNAHHPDLICGEVVVDPAYGGSAAEGDNAPALLARLRRDAYGIMEHFVQGAFSDFLSQSARETILDDIHRANPVALADFYASEYLDRGAFGLLRHTAEVTGLRTKPVLGIYGTQARGRMERSVDPSPLPVDISVWKGGHGHFLHMEDPSRFVGDVDAFVSRYDLDAGLTGR